MIYKWMLQNYADSKIPEIPPSFQTPIESVFQLVFVMRVRVRVTRKVNRK